MNTKSKFEKNLNKIIYIIQIIASVILIYISYNNGSIPNNYVLYAAIICVLLLIGEYFLIFYYKKSKSKRSIITQILSVLLSIVMFVASSYIYQYQKVVDLMGEETFQTRAISVIVLEESEIANETQLVGKNLGYISYIDSESMEYALDDIETNIGSVKVVDCDDFSQLIEALYDESVDAIILDESFRELATEDYDDFDDETRVVYQVTKDEETVSSKSVDLTTTPFIVFISGNDNYGELSEVSKTDVNLVVAVNPTTYQILMISIPRDTYYPLHSYGQYDKFTHSGFYGIDESIATLEDMLGEDINYYIRLNFTSFMNIIDALGGITVDVPVYETVDGGDGTFTTYKSNITISPGINNFNSEEALAFVRERKAFVAGDFVRGQNQQLVLEAVINKLCSTKILTSFSSVLEAITDSIDTNFSSDEINSFVAYELKNMPDWNIQSYQIQGDVATKPCYSSGYQELSVVVPYQSNIARAREYIDMVIDGETLDLEDDEESSETESE